MNQFIIIEGEKITHKPSPSTPHDWKCCPRRPQRAFSHLFGRQKVFRSAQQHVKCWALSIWSEAALQHGKEEIWTPLLWGIFATTTGAWKRRDLDSSFMGIFATTTTSHRTYQYTIIAEYNAFINWVSSSGSQKNHLTYQNTLQKKKILKDQGHNCFSNHSHEAKMFGTAQEQGLNAWFRLSRMCCLRCSSPRPQGHSLAAEGTGRALSLPGLPQMCSQSGSPRENRQNWSVLLIAGASRRSCKSRGASWLLVNCIKEAWEDLSRRI